MVEARKYHRLALDCLRLADAAPDFAAQDQLVRMAETYARLADHAEAEHTPQPDSVINAWNRIPPSAL